MCWCWYDLSSLKEFFFKYTHPNIHAHTQTHAHTHTSKGVEDKVFGKDAVDIFKGGSAFALVEAFNGVEVASVGVCDEAVMVVAVDWMVISNKTKRILRRIN